MSKLKIIPLFLLFFLSKVFSQTSTWDNILEKANINDPKKCIYELSKIKTLLEKNNQISDSIYAKLLHILAKSYQQINDYPLAIQYYNKSIYINSENFPNRNKKHLALSYYNLGGIYSEIPDYYNSQICYNNCIIIWNKYHINSNLKGMVYYMKSKLLFNIGDFSNSLQFSREAFSILDLYPYYKIQSSIISIQCLIKLKNLKLAEINIEDTHKLIKTNNFEKTEAMASLLFLTGFLNEEKGNLKQANSQYLNSEKIYHQFKNNLGLSNIFISIGENEKKLKNYPIAMKFFKKAIKYSQENNIYKLRAIDNMGTILSIQNNYLGAIKTFQECFSLSLINLKLNPNPKTLIGKFDNEIYLELIQHKAETWLAFYHHTHKKEYLQNALETFIVADKMVDYMRREHVGYQSKLFWRDKTHALYENAIEVCFLLKNYEKAFYFFEKSRAVLLNDKINNLAANQILSEAEQIEERRFQQKIAALNAELEQTENEAEKSKLNVQLLDIQEKQQQFITVVAKKYPSYYQFKYDTTLFDLAQMKRYLQKQNLSFIEYFKGDSANYQLVIKQNGVEIIKQSVKENIFKYLQTATDLGHRVSVSQDGEFTPLDSLKTANKTFLLHKYAFSYTYSAQYLLRNANKKSENNYFKNFIGFAPVNYSKSMGLPTLLGADKALEKVASHFFWPNNFQNNKATKANFIQKANNYKIIQLFTHADADLATKVPTIFFADSALKVSDLEALKKFNSELLVLSACKTNVGKIAKGEGTLSMAREFAALGIPASITTLWAVENEATYIITELFYNYLQKGYTKDEALQKAKIEYLSLSSREKQNPQYWASFVLVGETAAISTNYFIYLLLIGLFAIAIVAVLFFKKYKYNPLNTRLFYKNTN